MSPVRRLLADADHASAYAVAMARHEAAHDAMRADLLDMASGRTTGFRRLNAMRGRHAGGEA